MANFRLHIPQPCHEKWEEMKPAEKGAYCSSCQKVVVDFSVMTDQEVKAYFTRRQKNVCGRFQKKQLEYSYRTSTEKESFWRRLVVAALLGLGLPGFVSAQEQKPKVKADTVQREPVYRPEGKEISNSAKQALQNKIEGVVVDAISKEPLPGTAIQIGNSNRGVLADMDGRFVLEKDMLQGVDSVEVSFIGFKNQTLALSTLQTNPVIILEEDLEILGQMVVLGGVRVTRWWSPRGLWWRVKSLFH